MPCTGAPVYFAGFFRYSLKWFWKNCGLCGCFFAVFFRCSVQGSNKAFLQGSLDILSAGGKQGIFAGFCRYSFSWSLEKSWYVPVFFCWLLVKKLIFQKTLPGVVICVNENWVALLFQDSLVLCSVKCKGWPFGTILVWRLGPLPCLAKVLSGLILGARARADLERSNHTTENLRIIFTKHKWQATKNQITGFRSPPHRLYIIILTIYCKVFPCYSTTVDVIKILSLILAQQKAMLDITGGHVNWLIQCLSV